LATEQASAPSVLFERVRAFARSSAAAPCVLAAMVVVSVLARVWLARSVKTPWILGDEYIYSELAKSFAGSGHFLVRGASAGIYSYLYPVLIAPAWLAHSMQTTYVLAKAINAVVMSLAAVPVYLWGKRLAPKRYALVAVALTLLLPSFFYTSELMTENGFFTAFVFAVFMIALVIERPTLSWQALMLLAFGLAAAIRFQALVLLAVLPTAVLLKLAIDLLGRGSEPRRRVVRRDLVPLWPTAAALVAAGAAYAAYKHAQGVPLGSGLGAYQGVTGRGYPLALAARWVLYHFAELPLAAGYVPACAFLLVLGLALVRPKTLSAAERSFAAAAAAAVIWLVAEVATFASRYSLRVEERYMFPVAPLLLLALALWFARGMPRPPLITFVAIAVPAGLLLTLPLASLLNVSIISDTFGLIPLFRLTQKLSGGAPLVKQLVVAGGVIGGLLFAFTPRRYAVPAIVGSVAIFLILTSYSVHGTIRDYARNLAASAGVLGDPTWIDERGRGRNVGVLYGDSLDTFQEATALWEAEFWNRRLARVYTFGNQEPVGFAETVVRLDPASGRLMPAVGASATVARELTRTRYILTDAGTDLLGGRSAQHGPFELYALTPPPRLASLVSGLYGDGWAGADASYTRYASTRHAAVEVTVSRAAWGGPDVPGDVTVSVIRPGRTPRVRRRAIHSKETWRMTLAVPSSSFAVTVHVSPTFSPARFGLSDTRQLGAQVLFRYISR
jgi:hypothetical protein